MTFTKSDISELATLIKFLVKKIDIVFVKELNKDNSFGYS